MAMELGLRDKVEIHPENKARPNTGANRLVYPFQRDTLPYTATHVRRLLQVTHAAHSAPLALGQHRIDLVIGHYPQTAVNDAFKELLE